jgi:hypothetical protein
MTHCKVVANGDSCEEFSFPSQPEISRDELQTPSFITSTYNRWNTKKQNEPLGYLKVGYFSCCINLGCDDMLKLIAIRK